MASSVVSDNFETSTGAIPNMGGADITTRLCSAWVNFNGTGTVAIRSSYNVSSITDNGTANYAVNFTNNMVDTDYSVSMSAQYSSTSIAGLACQTTSASNALGSVPVRTSNSTGAQALDLPAVYVQIFSN
jgi:hypothetical protein